MDTDKITQTIKRYNVAGNSDRQAIYDLSFSPFPGFLIWCTPDENPGGVWKEIRFEKGEWSKPCSLIGAAYWGYDKDKITHLCVFTMPAELKRQLPHKFQAWDSIFNRQIDLLWVEEKIKRLFQLADQPELPIRILQLEAQDV